MSKEEQDKKDLEDYLLKLFNLSSLNARIYKQINQFIKEYNYTYSVIKKALIYFYDIKGNSIEKANGGLGIVPYIYQEAFNYYLALWQAQQKNEDKVINDYRPNVIEIKVPRPQRKIKKRKLFTFLEQEDDK
jgi:hypothetical protein